MILKRSRSVTSLTDRHWRKKAFLFVGATHARLKLRESIPEATKLAAKEPEIYAVGSVGWVKLALDGEALAKGVLERWVGESYRIALGPPKKKT